MLILGLLLVAAGAAVIVAAVFTAEVTGGHIEIIGIEVGAITLFVLGIAAGVAILWGFSIGKFGARRSLRQRRESQRLRSCPRSWTGSRPSAASDADEDKHASTSTAAPDGLSRARPAPPRSGRRPARASAARPPRR